MGKTARVRIPLRDQLWLHMDRADNLMYITSLVWFSEIPDWDAVTEAVATRMVGPHPVFRRVPVREGRRMYWEDDPDFDLSHHLIRGRLPAPGGRAEAEAYVSEQMSIRLPDDRPLWRAEFLEGYHGHGHHHGHGNEAEREGALVLFRVQHGMVDGMRLTQLILGLCDSDEDAQLPRVGRPLSAGGGGILGTVGSAGLGMVRDSFGIARGLAGATVAFPWTLTRLVRDVVAPGRGFTRVPTRVVESLADSIDPTNKTTNTYRSTFRLLFEPRSPELSWSGHAHVQKKVSWISGLDLAAIKRVAKAHGTTVTTVMLAAVSRALTEYLDAHGDRRVSDIKLMVPMSIEPIGDELPEELGNHLTIILMRLPLGIDDADELIDTIATSMTRVRYSFEPHVNFATMLGVAVAPGPVAHAVVDLLANKTVGQLTSVPGPVSTVRIAGTPVEGILGWVPMSGDQAFGICIFSYNGTVSVSIATDAGLVPDPGEVAGMIDDTFATFAGWHEGD